METSTIPNPFVTIYKHDYVHIHRGSQFQPKKDNKKTHTLSENYSFVDLSDESPPPKPSPVDFAQDYLENTFKKDYPKLYKKYFHERIQTADIEKELLKDSQYVKDYCRHMKGPVQHKFDIDINAQEAIETSMKDHYRPPSQYATLTHYLAHAPPSALAKNHQVIISISNVASQSEYSRTFGETGKFIMKNEVYGKMIYPS